MVEFTVGQPYKDILFDVEEQIGWITINRPDVLNAIRERTLDEIIHALKSTRSDPTIAAVVIRGSGDRSFCAGGEFAMMRRFNWANAMLWNERMLDGAMTMRSLPIPVIAMVDGWCIGGGNEIALWCDMVVASDTAVFGQSGAKVGACPTVGATQYLSRSVGERVAREMIFCARRLTAQEAFQYGLVNHCVPKAELLAKTKEICEAIKANSSQTVRLTKASLNQESDHLYASWRSGMEFLAHVWGSEECNEGMDAFLEKRKPDFNKFRVRNKEEIDEYINGVVYD
ncbi:MAG: enoyl-CoA hydratase/isomerase family protein [Rhodospirillum sp.]|nr:enoyl-CoA hydratase/isomerase family protein [Rhodospirillum sp.]MCF8490574.1 enoyl-CoA hydratase/isomerase family protein [Rhodospirillum sp.]